MNKYQSKWEARIANFLEERGIKFGYEVETWKYQIKPYNAKCFDCESKEVYEIRKYTPDFFLPNGIVIEAKGKFTSAMRAKILAVIESNPDKDLRLLFAKDNYLTSAKKKRYTEWAKQKGIKSAVGEIPEEWLNEQHTKSV